MIEPMPTPPLGLTDDEADARFDAQQEKLAPLWRSIRAMTADEQTIVVAPSLSIDFEASPAITQAYEDAARDARAPRAPPRRCA